MFRAVAVTEPAAAAALARTSPSPTSLLNLPKQQQQQQQQHHQQQSIKGAKHLLSKRGPLSSCCSCSPRPPTLLSRLHICERRQRLPVTPRLVYTKVLAMHAAEPEEEEEQEDGNAVVVVSFYKFGDLSERCQQLREQLIALCKAKSVSGFAIAAAEGINGSISGRRCDVRAVLTWLETEYPQLSGLRRLEAPATVGQIAEHNSRIASGGRGRQSSALEEDEKDEEEEEAAAKGPFRWDHVRVKVKPEIVTMGVQGVDPRRRVGKYVRPEDWNALISDPNTILIDTRNEYETRVGKFRGAIDPHTSNFRQFPDWVQQNIGPLLPSPAAPMTTADAAVAMAAATDTTEAAAAAVAGAPVIAAPAAAAAGMSAAVMEGTSAATCSPASPPRVAMYCTGGIRCEKATAYMLELGFEEVYHLEGGILNYLRTVSPSESMWDGECFVFDDRVAVKPGLVPGSFRLCHACKEPVSEEDTRSPEWREGVSCPHCFGRLSEEKRARAEARQVQYERWGRVGGPLKEGAVKTREQHKRHLERRHRKVHSA